MGVKMFGWLEKLIVKNAVKRVIKKLPKLKDKSQYLLDVYGDNLIEKVFKTIEQVVTDFAEDHKIKP